MNFNWLVQYPIWDLDMFGGGFLIALIATLHVYIAHFAVGGGFFLVLTEIKAHRESSAAIMDYVRRHSWFFLLLSMVFGGVSGVGIWFVISVLHPAATSILVHSFVFAWATEWVFFLGEIIALLVYVHTFDKLDKRSHLTIGIIYAVFAWLSLFVINGIVAFMLTPGNWVDTGNFWDGFFNPSFLPSLAFRTALSLMLAGVFGWATCVYSRDEALRRSLSRYCSWWLLVPFIFVMCTAYMYVEFLPAPQKAMVLSKSPETLPFMKLFLVMGAVLLLAGAAMAVNMNQRLRKAVSLILLISGFLFLGSFEWIREAGRRPFIIFGHLFSNSVAVKDVKDIQERGVLKTARWVKNRELTDDNRKAAGKEIYGLLCSSCHSVGGPVNDIIPLVKTYNRFGMDAMLSGMGKLDDYMPVFFGTPEERCALAEYLTEELTARQETKPSALDIPAPETGPGRFDPETDEYVLPAWSSRGLYAMTDADRYFSINGPGCDIHAQLLRRGELPEHVYDGVELEYRIEKGFDRPADHVAFWDSSEALTGEKMEPHTGVTGNKTSGKMKYDEETGLFSAVDIPLVPYAYEGKDGKTVFNPYPVVKITAKDSSGGAVLASVTLTIAVSTELSCKTCHGGSWRVNGSAGLSSETARNILANHDRRHRTRLTQSVGQGKPVACKSCHNDESGSMNLSASIHGFHAVFLSGKGADACAACHPESPSTKTAAYRGVHKDMGITCTGCHGVMEDMALGLLMAEKAAGKESASRLIPHLRPSAVESPDDAAPRKPWVNEPDCLNCHVDFEPPETDIHEFNLWTPSKSDLFANRTDEAGISCPACHGSPHAIYPATNPAGPERENRIPVQYQNNPYPLGANMNCRLCHTIDMEYPLHHPNMAAMFRNTR